MVIKTVQIISAKDWSLFFKVATKEVKQNNLMRFLRLKGTKKIWSNPISKSCHYVLYSFRDWLIINCFLIVIISQSNGYVIRMLPLEIVFGEEGPGRGAFTPAVVTVVSLSSCLPDFKFQLHLILIVFDLIDWTTDYI